MNWRLLLLPFSLIYAASAALRNLLYNKGVFKQHRFPVPVILVGNLNVGGTGKTPHVEYLLRLLSNRYRMATLSRGYGRKSKGFVIAGKGTTAEVIGDEPMQYFIKFSNVTVSVCEKRTEGITKLLALGVPPQVIVMDDGFQHRSVDPGFKILLTPYDKLFTDDYVLPAGDLREAASGYKRADCIIVTKVPADMSETEKQRIISSICPFPHQQVFFSHQVYGGLISFFSKTIVPLEKLSGLNVILFTGIARPHTLTNFIAQNALSLTTYAFPDHHVFSIIEMQKVIGGFKSADQAKTIILTTEKDYLRLQGSDTFELFNSLPCYYIPVTVEIDRKNEFETLVMKAASMNMSKN